MVSGECFLIRRIELPNSQWEIFHPIQFTHSWPPGPSLATSTPQPSSNLDNIHPQLHDPHFHPSPHHSSSWRPRTHDECHSWNTSPQGMFPSTLVGPGQNPNQLPHPQPRCPPNAGVTSGNGLGKRKRTTLPAEPSSFGGFEPISPGETTSDMSFLSPSPPPLASHHRVNAASDLWAFAHPLTSTEKPSVDERPTYLEPNLKGKPKTVWFGCKLCSKSGYAIV
jgi:hypothetical protein